MVKGLSKNPFPDEINVTFDTPNDAKAGALRLRRNPSVNKANAPVDCS
jgi:cell division protein FtsX